MSGGALVTDESEVAAKPKLSESAVKRHHTERRRASIQMMSKIKMQAVTRRRQSVTTEFNSLSLGEKDKNRRKQSGQAPEKTIVDHLQDKYGKHDNNDFYTPKVLNGKSNKAIIFYAYALEYLFFWHDSNRHC